MSALTPAIRENLGQLYRLCITEGVAPGAISFRPSNLTSANWQIEAEGHPICRRTDRRYVARGRTGAAGLVLAAIMAWWEERSSGWEAERAAYLAQRETWQAERWRKNRARLEDLARELFVAHHEATGVMIENFARDVAWPEAIDLTRDRWLKIAAVAFDRLGRPDVAATLDPSTNPAAMSEG